MAAGLFGEGLLDLVVEGVVRQEFLRTSGCETDWMARVLATPFNDPSAYGPQTAPSFMRPDVEDATAAVWIVGPQTGAVIHQLGSSETFLRSTGAKVAKRFDFVDAWFAHCYSGNTVDRTSCAISTIGSKTPITAPWTIRPGPGAAPHRATAHTRHIEADAEWPLPEHAVSALVP